MWQVVGLETNRSPTCVGRAEGYYADHASNCNKWQQSDDDDDDDYHDDDYNDDDEDDNNNMTPIMVQIATRGIELNMAKNMMVMPIRL